MHRNSQSASPWNVDFANISLVLVIYSICFSMLSALFCEKLKLMPR